MKTVRSPVAAARLAGSGPHPIVLVPTMGALHEGHLSLICHAKILAGRKGCVWVSVFVNPVQFGPGEDFSRYPRPFARDARLCREAGADVLFAPKPTGMYAPDHSVFVEESRLSAGLCGASRSGHFRGVCTVVAKLFHLTRADIAVFGEKDWQQLAVIRRMVRDLDFPVRIAAAPTIREPDGLAMSSRNAYLATEERAQAPVLRRALLAARERLLSGGSLPASRLVQSVIRDISRRPLAVVDYVEVVDADTLAPLRCAEHNVLVAVAVRFGKTRLIDNIHIP